MYLQIRENTCYNPPDSLLTDRDLTAPPQSLIPNVSINRANGFISADQKAQLISRGVTPEQIAAVQAISAKLLGGDSGVIERTITRTSKPLSGDFSGEAIIELDGQYTQTIICQGGVVTCYKKERSGWIEGGISINEFDSVHHWYIDKETRFRAYFDLRGAGEVAKLITSIHINHTGTKLIYHWIDHRAGT